MPDDEPISSVKDINTPLNQPLREKQFIPVPSSEILPEKIQASPPAPHQRYF